MRPFIIDAHQDIAYDIQSYGRDLTLPLEQIRALDKPKAIELNGTALLSAHEYRKANIKLIFGTLFAAPFDGKPTTRRDLHYSDQEEAYKLYQKQIQIYQDLFAHPTGSFTQVKTKTDLAKILGDHGNISKTGLFLSIEGADCIRELEDLHTFWRQGVRAIGPAWQKTRYCGGTDQPGDLTEDGVELLKKNG